MADCDHCHHQLSDRCFYLDRTVEIYSYSGNLIDGVPEHIQAKVLYCDSIRHFCSAGCAETNTPQTLQSLGLKILPPSIGPVETCAKCSGPVIMTSPHIAYGLIEATKVSKPWFTHLNVHNSEDMCVVCIKCDGDLKETEWQVAIEDEATLSEMIRRKSNEIV